MCIISKKRIQIMLSAILVGVLAFGMQISNDQRKELTVKLHQHLHQIKQ